MTYAQFIALLRAEAKDLAHPMHNDFTGDGTTTLFECTDKPILEASYIVRVGGTQKTESTDYTIDRELGLITFASAPGNAVAVTVDYKYVNLTDSSWLTIINNTLKDMEGDYFKELVEDFGDTVVDQLSYAGPTNCIDVVNLFYSLSDSDDSNQYMMSEFANWRYSKDENKIYLGRSFSTVYPMSVHYLKGYTMGTTTASNLDIQSKYEGVLQLGCMWKYYNYRLSDKVETTTKVTSEKTVTPLQSLQMLAAHYYKLYLKDKGRKKPTKPMRLMFPRNPSGGTP